MTLAKPAVPANRQFADYCCELLSTQGACVAKRMFGGFGISTDGLTLAIIADLGDGEKLYLKGSEDARARYEAAGSKIFIYDMRGVPKSMHYYTAPEEAMDSREAMLPWAQLALECALKARAAKPLKTPKPVKQAAKKAAPKAQLRTQPLPKKEEKPRLVGIKTALNAPKKRANVATAKPRTPSTVKPAAARKSRKA
jgi:DNA transformation protein and related proteins